MKKTISYEFDLEVEYDYIPATPGKWTLKNGDPGWPGEPAYNEIDRVKLNGHDITHILIEEDFEKLEEKL